MITAAYWQYTQETFSAQEDTSLVVCSHNFPFIDKWKSCRLHAVQYNMLIAYDQPVYVTRALPAVDCQYRATIKRKPLGCPILVHAGEVYLSRGCMAHTGYSTAVNNNSMSLHEQRWHHHQTGHHQYLSRPWYCQRSWQDHHQLCTVLQLVANIDDYHLKSLHPHSLLKHMD